MGGEQGQEGWANIKLFSEHARQLGWRTWGGLDRNAPCDACPARRSGDKASHGVDGLFSFACPFLRRERAVVVDGKRYAMGSVGGPAKLKEWISAGTKVADHLSRSASALQEQRSIPADVTTSLDTSIIAWDCEDGWDSEKAEGWLSESVLELRPEKAIQSLILTKDRLDWLATLSNFSRLHEELELYYFLEPTPLWHHVLVPEALFWHFIRVRYSALGSAKSGVLIPNWHGAPLARSILKFLASSDGLSTDLTFFVRSPKHTVPQVTEVLTTERDALLHKFDPNRRRAIHVEQMTSVLFSS